MDIEEIGAYLKTNVDLLLGTVPRSPSWQVRNNLIILSDRIRREGVDVVEDDEPPVSVDDGFAILPMERYEALRQAEENLQETRFDGVSKTWYEAFEAERAKVRAMKEEIGRLKEAAAPLKPAGLGTTAGEPQFHPVLDKHLQDLQAEIDAIKDRLDELVNNLGAANLRYGHIKNRLDETMPSVDAKLDALGDRINAVAARLDAAGPAVGDSIGAIFDRMGALTARLNKLDAREVAKT
jgi:ElaB/YqjD/DUF883 family membrane-anchored ribosome-binding protein